MKFVVLAGKIVITGAIIWVLLTHVDFAPIGHFLRSDRGILALAACIAVLLLQAWLAALRLRWIMRLLAADCPMQLGFSTWLMGLLVGQTMVTFIAGDAVRVWRIAQRGYGKRLSGSAIFLERALGFAVLMGLVLLCLPVLLAHGATGAVRAGLLTIGALCAVGIAGFAASGFFGRVVARIAPRLHANRIASAAVDVASAARHMAVSPPLTAGIIALSAVMHLLNAATFYILGTAVGTGLGLDATIVVALPVMLIALMPIALAGWGVREGSAVVGFGLFGVPPEMALTISVGFGLALLAASLPGAYYLWFNKSAAATTVERTGV
jgi:uncharacterized protein (TIRG00374 family)